MSPEERQLLTGLFERIQTATATARDGEAEQLIAEAVRREPSAPYYLAQAVIVQEKGLEAASKRISELEARIRQLETAQPAPVQEQRGGFLSSIFGSSQPPQQQQPAPPQPQRPYNGAPTGPWGQSMEAAPQQPQPYGQPQPTGPWTAARSPSGGSSFLTGALGTAAGVAGGMLLANSLSGIFSHHMAGLGLGSPVAEGLATAPIEETVINNYYGDAAGNNDANTSGNAAQPDTQTADDNIQQADYDDSNDWSSGDDGDFGGDDSSYA
ncbi:DUF2076 domain-containing protein [Rhizobium helianthi]|uniref:DUF2076 domain-containing protein n=1 Tax=Rhizobium helianthi TaxID=1132695 RepID=A0ABW4M463_9HYPH